MTNMIGAGPLVAEQILKTDVAGRVHTPKARREALLNEFEQSGLSGVEFSKLIGIKYQTFATWAKKRRKEHAQSGSPALTGGTAKTQWIEGVVGKEPPVGAGADGLAIYLPGGARIEASDSKQVALAAHLLRLLAC